MFKWMEGWIKLFLKLTKSLLIFFFQGSPTPCGFNVNTPHTRARIGVLGKESYIGFGTGGTGSMGNISCGNVFQNKALPAFGYIMVR